MNDLLRVLVVEDVEDDARLLLRELENGGFVLQSEIVTTAGAMREALARQTWDIIFADYSLPAFNGLEALAIARKSGLDLPFILVSGTIGEEIAVMAMKAGAHDYMMKGHFSRLVPAVKRELADARVRQEHKQNERQLRQLSTAVNQCPVSIIITDPDGKIEYVNPKFTAVTGYSSAEALGQKTSLLKSGEMRSEEYRCLWKTITGGREWRGEFHNRKKSGELFWEQAAISPIFDADGHISHFLAVKEDITERKLQDQKIREQAALLDKAQDAIWVQDLEGRILYWNTGASRIYGWAVPEATGCKIAELLGLSAPRYEAVIKVVREKGDWQGELTTRTKAGQEAIIEARWTLVQDQPGNSRSVLAINTNITEKKKIESQFLRAQRMESLGTLAGGIAHDLNNILTPLFISLQMLKEKSGDSETQELIETLESNVQRGSSLVKHVLAFGRGVKGDRIAVDPKHIAGEIRHIVEETFPKSVEFDFYSATGLWIVTGDPTQLHQVMLNLCVNARDAMPSGGKLSLRMENVRFDQLPPGMNLDAKIGPYVMITVTDTGTGIPKEIQDRIFDPFFTTKDPGNGTGLGLATTLAIVKSHGGFIDFTSEPGRGTCFKVYFPANTTPDTNEKETQEQSRMPHGNGELVLFVDDEAPIRKLAQSVLKRFGYRVLTAANGLQAIFLYQTQPQDIAVVITDMIMPDQDGPTTIAALKAINPKVKIIASSGMVTDNERINIEDAGVRHFIPKPYTTETLLHTLRDILKETP
jgi:PAS domain S-box-containing protein